MKFKPLIFKSQQNPSGNFLIDQSVISEKILCNVHSE